MPRTFSAVLVAACSLGLLLAACDSSQPARPAAQPAPARTPASTNPATTTTAEPTTNLQPGSDPSVLPGPVLIADHLNNRLLIVDPHGQTTWSFPRPGDLAPGQTFLVPDDAFFTPDGKNIIATQEDDAVISLISVASHRILWRYGTPGVPGSGPNQVSNPDDAMMMPDGNIITADIKNCRILILRPGSPDPLHIYGETTTDCRHGPPDHWGSPNGAFPMLNGDYLVTEINDNWVDGLTLGGQVTFSTHPPGVSYPSDTIEVSNGVLLTADYSTPGQVEEFTPTGQLLWRYPGPGQPPMNKPSLALPMANGDVLANDDYNHRVIVIDPHTNQIVWQYGHTGVSGSTPGYLNDPDGVDLSPPQSLTIARSTMGNFPVPPGAGPVPGQTRSSAP